MRRSALLRFVRHCPLSVARNAAISRMALQLKRLPGTKDDKEIFLVCVYVRQRERKREKDGIVNVRVTIKCQGARNWDG